MKKLDYKNLSKHLIFVDTNITDHIAKYSTENNDYVMIEQILNEDCYCNNLKENISLSNEPSNVKSVLFFLSEIQDQEAFIRYIKPIVELCRTTFKYARIILDIFDDAIFEEACTHDFEDIQIGKRDPKRDGLKDYFNWIKNFNHKRINFVQCHHLLLEYMEKRCQDNKNDIKLVFDPNNTDNFCIQQDSIKLNFIRNVQNKSYFIYDSSAPEKLLLEIRNDHLLGLYNPTLIFDIVAQLKSFSKTPIQIRNNEIILFNNSSKNTDLSTKDILENIILKIDQFVEKYELKKFRIQLGSDNYLVLNRRLKISFFAMKFLLENNFTELLFDLAFLYFKCFSIAPTCCRMQSLVPEAIVYDFEKFTYLHIDRYRFLYIKMSKLLFPYIVDVDENLLQRKYLEIIPVTLIGRFHGIKLEKFNKNLLKLINKKISIIPLANGNFRIGTHFNISPEMLSKMNDINKLEIAVKMLFECSKNSDQEFFRHEDFDYNSSHCFEFDTIHIIENGKTYESKLENIPKCEKQLCTILTPRILTIFKFKQHHVFAIEVEKNDIKNKEELTKICEHFAEAFDDDVIPLEHPFKNDVENLSFSWNINFKTFDQIMKAIVQFNKTTSSSTLAIMGNRIDTIENLNMVLQEQNPDYYKGTADFCYYDEDELVKFFEEFQKIQSEKITNDLIFEITTFGLIKFNNRIEIRPSTFMNVKNMPKLLFLVKLICSFMYEKPKSIVNCKHLKNFNSSKSSLSIAISIAKQINPLLNALYLTKFFEIPNFYCLPCQLYYTQEGIKILKALEELRSNKRIRVRLSHDAKDILLNCSWFTITIFEFAPSFSEFYDFNELMETINSDFDGCYIMKKPTTLEIIDYDNFEKAAMNPDLVEEQNIDENDLQICFEMFDQHADRVRIVENKFFHINSGLGISSQNLMKMLKTSKMLFEAAKLFGEFFENAGQLFSDNWINIGIEKSITKEIQVSEKFKAFTIIDNNEESYVKLAKTFTQCLRNIPAQQLLLYKWLELLPKQFLMDEHAILQLFEIIQDLGNVKLDNSGCIKIGNLILPVFRLFQIHDNTKFKHFINEMDTYELFRMQKSGLLRIPLYDVLLKNKAYEEKINKSDFQQMISRLLKNIEKSITLNSSTHLMLGNFIWIDVRNINEEIEEKLIKVVKSFEEVFQEGNKDFMRSIHGLVVKEKAIQMIKLINPNLEKFSDDLICNKNLRILPTDLWKRCEKDPETYDIAIKVFKILETEKMYWTLQLNGNVEIMEKLVVSVTDILHLYKNKKFSKDLLKLLIKLNKKQHYNLLCQEEVKYRQIIDEKTHKTKFNLKKSKDAKNVMEKKKKVFCRIEPTGTLFINNNLWVMPEDALTMNSCAVPVSKKIKEIFPDLNFQYGNQDLSIFTSATTVTDKQLYQYCYSVCQFIQTECPKITIKYLPQKDVFQFNEFISIHPRSFCHLQDMDKVIEILKNFDELRNTNPSFLKSNNPVSEEEKQFCKELLAIKSRERVEFDVVRDRCFKELGKIFFENMKDLRNIGNIDQVITDNEESYYGIENVTIHGYQIFEGGIANAFVTSKNDDLEFLYSENIIVEALKFVDEMKHVEDKCKCKNLFDFQSIIEILHASATFLMKKDLQNTDFPETFEELSRNQKIFWWLEKVQEQQNNDSWIFKFSNAIKGLHHWFKHSQGFKNLVDYYAKMNEFFGTENYTMELDTQNGNFLNRRYENEAYTGAFMLAHNDSGRNDCVATFYAREKTIPLNFLDEKSLSSASAIILTDKPFKSYVSENQIKLNDNTAVFYLKQVNFIAVQNYFSRTLKFSHNLKKIIIFSTAQIKPKLKKKQNAFKKFKEKTDEVQVRKKIEINRINSNTVTGSVVDTSKPKLNVRENEKTTINSQSTDNKITSNFKDELLLFKKMFFEKMNNPLMIVCYSFHTEKDVINIMKSTETEKFKCFEIEENLIKNNNANDLKKFLKQFL